MDHNKKADDFLMHYGVMGMRWGKRKGPSQTSTSTTGGRRMSNKELNARVKRLRLEEELARLTAKPSTPSKIEKIAKSAATVAALTTTGLTIYKNMDTIVKIAKSAKKVT